MTTAHRDLVLTFDARQRNTETQLVSTSPLEIITPARQWSYGAWMLCDAVGDAPPGAQLAVTVRLEVRQGCVGVGWTRQGHEDFVVEKYLAEPGLHTITLRVPPSATPGRLMFRNASASGASHLLVLDVGALVEAIRPYPVAVEHRPFQGEPEREDGAVVFEDELARAINRARLDFITSLGLPLRGKRVLDVGCGVGHHTALYTAAGAEVVGLDGRAENIAAMARLYPSVTGLVGDVQEMDLASLGEFDIVHCFGLVYHLESPVAALRRLAHVCREHLIVETLVCDAVAPVMILVDEARSANQALAGLGCRPSPSFVAMALDRIGFAHVYGTTSPPQHPDFLFEWRDSMDISRAGQNLRCVFVASRVPLVCSHLVDLIARG